MSARRASRQPAQEAAQDRRTARKRRRAAMVRRRQLAAEREALVTFIEALVTRVDEIDGDPDLEPDDGDACCEDVVLQGGCGDGRPGDADDAEDNGDDEHSGDDEPDADDEYSDDHVHVAMDYGELHAI